MDLLDVAVLHFEWIFFRWVPACGGTARSRRMFLCWWLIFLSCVVSLMLLGAQGRRSVYGDGYGMPDRLWGVRQGASIKGHLGLLRSWSGWVLHQGWQSAGLQKVQPSKSASSHAHSKHAGLFSAALTWLGFTDELLPAEVALINPK